MSTTPGADHRSRPRPDAAQPSLPASEAQLARHALRCVREARDHARAAGPGRRGCQWAIRPTTRSPSISTAKCRSRISRPRWSQPGSRRAGRSFAAWRSSPSSRATSPPISPRPTEPQLAAAGARCHHAGGGYRCAAGDPPRWRLASPPRRRPSSRRRSRGCRGAARRCGRPRRPCSAAVPAARSRRRLRSPRAAGICRRRAAVAEADAAPSPAVAAAMAASAAMAARVARMGVAVRRRRPRAEPVAAAAPASRSRRPRSSRPERREAALVAEPAAPEPDDVEPARRAARSVPEPTHARSCLDRAGARRRLPPLSSPQPLRDSRRHRDRRGDLRRRRHDLRVVLGDHREDAGQDRRHRDRRP